MTLKISNLYEQFLGLDGKPANDAYIFIGKENLDPKVLANRVSVYYDKALTDEASQPIRTVNGFPSKNGSPANLYTAQGTSVLVENNLGVKIAEDLNYTYRNYDGAVNVKEFGVVGDGVTDDAPAIRKALDYMGANPGRLVFPPATYYVDTSSSPIYIPITRGIVLEGYGATLQGPGNFTGTIFETAQEAYSTGATSNWDLNEQYLHTDQHILGFEFNNCRYAAKVFNFLNGCSFSENRSTGTCNTLLYSKRCWHTTVARNYADANDTAGAYADTDASFHFESFINAQDIRNNSCTRGNTDGQRGVGFYFNQGCAGLLMSNNTVSKTDKAILIKGEVQGMIIDTAYLENNVNDIWIEDTNVKSGLIIQGCFFNNEGAGKTIHAESWVSGELGINHWQFGAATVDLSDSINSCHVWLPRVVDASGNEYTANQVPSNWSINGSCYVHQQYNTNTSGGGPSAVNYGQALDGLGPNYIVPRYYWGQSNLVYSPPWSSVDVDTTLGDAVIDTLIDYQTHELGVFFTFRVSDSSTTRYINGLISNTTIFRLDAESGITVTASNNSGKYRISMTGFSTATAVTVRGATRII